MEDITIIGAGPYGISLAAHAAARGLSYALLGQPMQFWKDQMPPSMYIRTNPQYISLSDPDDAFTIQRYSAEAGVELTSPFPRPVFVRYALWFIERTGVEFTHEMAGRVERTNDGFAVLTTSGRRFDSRNVIVASGLQHYAHVPEPFASLPGHLTSHTFGQTDFTGFAGRRVAVIGSGQSAWETAGLLHLAGAKPELLYRREAPNYGGMDNLATGQRLIESADTFYHQPIEVKLERWNAGRQGSVAQFLKPYVEGKVPQTAGVTVDRAEPSGASARVRDGVRDGARDRVRDGSPDGVRDGDDARDGSRDNARDGNDARDDSRDNARDGDNARHDGFPDGARDGDDARDGSRDDGRNATADGGVRLTLSNGEVREYDHVITATGYRIDLDRVPFLPASLRASIEREAHGFARFPLLSAEFESSVPGLYFAGPLASHTHGGAFGFIAGVRKACTVMIPAIRQGQGAVR